MAAAVRKLTGSCVFEKGSEFGRRSVVPVQCHRQLDVPGMRRTLDQVHFFGYLKAVSCHTKVHEIRIALADVAKALQEFLVASVVLLSTIDIEKVAITIFSGSGTIRSTYSTMMPYRPGPPPRVAHRRS